MTNNKLTVQYLDEHSGDLHTPESFGRGLIAMAMQAARAQLAKAGDGKESVTLACSIEMTPFQALGCIRICVNTPVGVVCYHVNV
tara:strand:- start:5961 stop:6215 length:255 start_codon:yes stop_codon:yes gene_type:complete